MGIVHFKPKYVSLPTEDSINGSTNVPTNGMLSSSSNVGGAQYEHRSMSSSSEKDRYAVAGDVV